MVEKPEEEVREEREATSKEITLIDKARDALQHVVEALDTELRSFSETEAPPRIDEEHLADAHDAVEALFSAVRECADSLGTLEDRRERIDASIKKAKLLVNEQEKNHLAEQETAMSEHIDVVLLSLAGMQEHLKHLHKNSTLERLIRIRDETDMTDDMRAWNKRIGKTGVPGNHEEAVRVQNGLYEMNELLSQARSSLHDLGTLEEELEMLIISKEG